MSFVRTLKLYGKPYTILNFDDIVGTCFGFIYVTVNKLNGKKYLGLHYKWDKRYLGSGIAFKRALSKYGRGNFTRYIIDIAYSYDDLVKLEGEYIQHKFPEDIAYSDGWYNILSGVQKGGNTWAGLSKEERRERVEPMLKATRGKPRTKEVKEKLRKIALDRYSDPKERERQSTIIKKAMNTPEMIQKMKRINKENARNRFISDETRELYRESMREIGKKNKGVKREWKPRKETTKQNISKSNRGYYNIYVDDILLIKDINCSGGADNLVRILYNLTGFKISSRTFQRIVSNKLIYTNEKKEIYNMRIENTNERGRRGNID